MVSAEPALLLRLGTTALSLESCSVGVLLLAALAWLALHVWQHHAVGACRSCWLCALLQPAECAAGLLNRSMPRTSPHAITHSCAAAHCRRPPPPAGSHAIPAGVASPPGCRPLLGHALPILANLHRIHDWLLEQVRRRRASAHASQPLGARFHGACGQLHAGGARSTRAGRHFPEAQLIQLSLAAAAAACRPACRAVP